MVEMIKICRRWLAVLAISVTAPMTLAQDLHSYAQLDQVSTQALHLDVEIDFATQQVKGSARYELVRHTAAEVVYFDTRELTIERVELATADGWQPTTFSLAAADPNLGQALQVQIGRDATAVRIHYASAPSASGLQWLTPEQTAGKQQPFMFSQSQAIHARSWIPIQDTPALRLTYTAEVRTQPGLLVVMSANNPLTEARSGSYQFAMPQAIPPYLIAIAAGELAIKSINEQVAIFAEPYILERAAWEFADTPRMIEVTERLYGPYLWERYDLLVLPPSFPFGGMENPRLSFITPTVVAGDRSLINLIAHELAHSWSGNLVTNATWRDLWINEGFTSYVENRIMEALFGEDRARMELALGYQDLQADLARLPAADTIMHVDLTDRDPDDAFSQIPYVKGQLFLLYLEQQVGRAAFDQFLRQYFSDFAFQSVDTATLRAYLQQHLVTPNAQQLSMAVIDQWLYQPGLPDDAPMPVSDAFVKVEQQMQRWLKGGQLQTRNWTVHEWLHFINNLPLDISAVNMTRLDREFQLTDSSNSEIAHAWLKLAIVKKYEPARPRLRSYLLEIGRNKLVNPLYRALAQTPDNLQWARAVYEEAKAGYHPLTQAAAERVLYPEPSENP